MQCIIKAWCKRDTFRIPILFKSLTHQADAKFSVILFYVPGDFCNEFFTLELPLS